MCPECLRDVMHTLAPANYKTLLAAVKKEAADMHPDEVFVRYPPTETAQELMDTWGKGHRAFMRVVDLSASWTTILKLQILLQVRSQSLRPHPTALLPYCPHPTACLCSGHVVLLLEVGPLPTIEHISPVFRHRLSGTCCQASVRHLLPDSPRDHVLSCPSDPQCCPICLESATLRHRCTHAGLRCAAM